MQNIIIDQRCDHDRQLHVVIGMQKTQEGTLWKWTNYWNGWQPRWFVLDKGTLSYFKSQEEMSLGCKGSVNVAAAEITAHPSDPYRLDVIVPGEMNFYLRAGSPHERQEWLVALGSVKSCVNTEKASKGIAEEEKLKRKQCELRLYCDLLVQQVHSIKGLVVDSPIPDVTQLDENTTLLSETCDTFIRTLDACMKLTYGSVMPGERKTPPSSPPLASPSSPQNLPPTGHNPRSKMPRDFVVRQVPLTLSNSEAAHASDPIINGKITGDMYLHSKAVPTFFSEMDMSFAKIILGEDGSVPTEPFLQSCFGLVRILDHLGDASFAPVKMDLSNNFRKLMQKYESNSDNFGTLQCIINDEVEKGASASPNSATEALLWTKRGLLFLRQFLDAFEQGQADLAKACMETYTQTLRPYHDWVIRGVFTIACKSATSRATFTASLAIRSEDIGTEAFERQLRSDIISCIAGIDRCLRAIEKIFSKYELDGRPLID